jgi:hypothetical protein
MDNKTEFVRSQDPSLRYHPPSQGSFKDKTTSFQEKHKSNSILSKRAKFGLSAETDDDARDSFAQFNNQLQR